MEKKEVLVANEENHQRFDISIERQATTDI
jgi:hypothetical protein